MYDKFRSNEPIWSLANQLALAKLRTESLEMEREEKTAKRIEEGIKQGIEQGIEQGVEIGKKEMLVELLKGRYQKDCSKWIEGLNEKQIKLIYEYIFKEDDFEQLKQLVDNIYGFVDKNV